MPFKDISILKVDIFQWFVTCEGCDPAQYERDFSVFPTPA